MTKGKISFYIGIGVCIFNFINAIIIMSNNGFWAGFAYSILCIYCYSLVSDNYKLKQY